jgi:hypothetical protein
LLARATCSSFLALAISPFRKSASPK